MLYQGNACTVVSSACRDACRACQTVWAYAVPDGYQNKWMGKLSDGALTVYSNEESWTPVTAATPLFVLVVDLMKRAPSCTALLHEDMVVAPQMSLVSTNHKGAYNV